MQTMQYGQSASPASNQAVGSGKVASPLHREIEELKSALDHQSKTLGSLRERLAPLFRNEVAEKTAIGNPPEAVMAEMPTRVRDCKSHAMSNTSELQWLLERLEV